MTKIKCAIIGPGNIGTDLLYKLRRSALLEPVWMVGVEETSEGLARARALGLKTTHHGVDGMVEQARQDGVQIAFDATSAYVHAENAGKLNALGALMIDLTPAAIGPMCVPPVNLATHASAGAMNVNMVTCGGQATIPMVYAVSRVAQVHYGEIVASIASKSAGPGTRANIDEFTETTARGIEQVGGARRGKAIIILNPAEPPLVMRDTVFTLSDPADERAITDSIEAMVREVQSYVPGYRLKQDVQFELHRRVRVPGVGWLDNKLQTSIFLEVEGAGHYLPAWAGNLDIMTSAALATAERRVQLGEVTFVP